jgi:hypothetical protein
MLADPARYGDRVSRMDNGSNSLDTTSLLSTYDEQRMTDRMCRLLRFKFPSEKLIASAHEGVGRHFPLAETDPVLF